MMLNGSVNFEWNLLIPLKVIDQKKNYFGFFVLQFTESKTQYVDFCQLRKQPDDHVLHLYGSPIPVDEESIFLGIIFIEYSVLYLFIKCLKAKSLKALNLVKVLSHTQFLPLIDRPKKYIVFPTALKVRSCIANQILIQKLFFREEETNHMLCLECRFCFSRFPTLL